METTGYLDASSAYALDQQLMTTPGFTLAQLMELAGLSVAQAVHEVVPAHSSILVICGPGNNGGDGLVAARHLTHFGHVCTVVYPKESKREPHYANLVQQCRDMGLEIRSDLPAEAADGLAYTAIVDAIFGFSFQGEPREPFASIIDFLKKADKQLVISVDVPSGWHVEEGGDWQPDVLISLTAPKLCAQKFTGRHFIGGRFLPPALAEEYKIQMPPYPGSSQVMEVDPYRGWEEEYAAYLAEKESAEFAQYEQQEQKGALDDESWEAQYYAYMKEKEEKNASTSDQ